MEATVLLADWAAAINGKLYIQGGGWDQVYLMKGAESLAFGIAARLAIAWQEANQRHHVVIRLRDADGNVVEPEPGVPFEVETDIEVGRPPGTIPGSDLNAVFAFNAAIRITPGRYDLTLDVNGTKLSSSVFDVRGSQ